MSNYTLETYLNSLPEDTEEIDVSSKGIINLDVTRFKNLKRLYCPNNQLTSLSLSKNLEMLDCDHNQLTFLDLNSTSLRELSCCHNQLTSLHLNLNLASLQELYCSNNCLTSLHLSENLQIIYCNNNHLTSLHLNEKVEYLDCSNNRLTSLHLNSTCLQELYCNYNQLTSLHLNLTSSQELYCNNNQLTSLNLNENLKILEFNYNPIYDIINSNDTNIIKQKLQVLNQFRFLYYCLKFKKQFRYLLWVKIREPKIRIKYSHDYLIKNLNEDTDLDELLENW
jgi:Leucine-rich repeat (LRR) protein